MVKIGLSLRYLGYVSEYIGNVDNVLGENGGRNTVNPAWQALGRTVLLMRTPAELTNSNKFKI